MPSEPAIASAPHLNIVPASVIPLPDAKPRRALKVCLLGYRSAPYGGGQGIYLKYLSKALVGIRLTSSQVSPTRTSIQELI